MLEMIESLATVVVLVPVMVAVLLGAIYGLGEVFNVFSAIGRKTADGTPGALSPRLFYLLSSLRLRCGVNHRYHLPKHRAFRIGQFVDQRKVIAVAIGQQLDVEAARQAGVIIGLRLVLKPWVSRWPTSSRICGACDFAGSKTAG